MTLRLLPTPAAAQADAPPDPDDWRCRCDGHPQPHVHCPWGGRHVHVIDDNGKETTDGS